LTYWGKPVNAGRHRMIVFLTPAHHAYTLREVVPAAAPGQVLLAAYESLVGDVRLPNATYVFTDFDRLSPSLLREVAGLYRRLRAAGLRVLNDPARFRTRSGLLRLLHDAGINDFNAYRIEENVRPRRWPVFVRTEGDHDAPVSDLLDTWAQVEQAVHRAVQQGVPVSQLLVVEYAAEPVRPGLFRKLACYRIGGASVAHTCVHDETWLVKYGKLGIAGEALYADELRIVRENPYGPQLQRAFDLAGVDYGRMDFGLVGGRVQIYEINTNPDTKFGKGDHPSALRVEAARVFRQNFLAALHGIDTPAS
jgi:hypothetical protein